MTTDLRVIGLDLSLTSTGIAGVRARDAFTNRIEAGKLDGPERLDRMHTTIRAAVSKANPGVVAIEAPAYSRNTGAAHERAGLWWLVYMSLWRARIPIVTIGPMLRAKYATGNGKSSKDKVLAAVIKRYPDIEVDGNDAADALVLAMMTADHYGLDVPDVPLTHAAALRTVRWPDLPDQE